jgi:DNA-binding NarL/FixJ family response regulator
VIVVDQRELIRGCLTFWLGGFGQELVVTSMSDVTTSLECDLLRRASAVLVGAGALVTADAWLERQVAWLLANRPDAPIVLITELQEARAVGALFGRLQLRGYIPTSSSVELAAAALQLVIAGGTYFPRAWDEDSAPSAPPALIDSMLTTESTPRLTPREWSVLDLLEHGLSNKLIAHRLGMSQSTVKVHVHNIIAKLRVRNRTGAAVARYGQSTPPSSPLLVAPRAEPLDASLSTQLRKGA